MSNLKSKNLPCLTITLIISVALTACSSKVQEISTFLDAKEAVYEYISIEMGEAYWNLYSDETIADLKAPKNLYTELYNNDTLIQIIDEWHPKRNKLKDKVLARRLEVWHNILTAAKINYAENNLALQNELEFWLGEDESAEGRPTIDELNQMMIKLMKQRNKQAQAMGYENYADLMLDIKETDSDWFKAFVTVLEQRTREPFQKLKAEYLEQTGNTEFTNDDARGLAMQYYINQITPDIYGDPMKAAMKEIIDGIGLDYDNLPFRVVENEMPPGIGGQGIAVQIPGDFRIALQPGLGLSTWMHELGHGLQAMFTSIESPILKGYEWSFGSANGGYAEGMAETSARFTRLSAIAKRYSEQSDEEIAEKLDNINKYLPAYLRYWLMIFMYEVEFYKDLDQDPVELKKKLMQECRLLDVLPNDTGPIIDMVYVSYPLYLQNYVIAEIVSWQVHTTLEDKFGESYYNNPETGQFLIDNFYSDGALQNWQERLEKVTGSKLDLDGYLTYYEM